MANSRDTQFAGYAALLLKEIDDEIKAMASERREVTEKEVARRLGTIHARRAYDLVAHAIETADYTGIKKWMRGENIPLFHKVVQSIPDMTELPADESSETPEFAQRIKSIAHNAYSTGRDDPLTERAGALEDALDEIITLCEQQMEVKQ